MSSTPDNLGRLHGHVLDEPAPRPRQNPLRNPETRRPLAIAGVVIRFGVYVLALPAVALLWFIHRYAVNMVFADQWHDIHIIALSHSGALTLGDLWAQHGENRVLVPDLLVLALAHTTHFNVVYEDYASGFLLIATAALLILAHRRRSRRPPGSTTSP